MNVSGIACGFPAMLGCDGSPPAAGGVAGWLLGAAGVGMAGVTGVTGPADAPLPAADAIGAAAGVGIAGVAEAGGAADAGPTGAGPEEPAAPVGPAIAGAGLSQPAVESNPMAVTEAVNAASETDRALARMICRRVDIVFLWIARSPRPRQFYTV
jgi:hypothetical protein